MAIDGSRQAATGDLTRALTFVRDQFTQWHSLGMIRPEEHAALDAYYQIARQDAESGRPPAEPITLPPADVCWSCKAPIVPENYCASCGAPVSAEAVDELRYLICLCHEIRKHERAGRLDLSAAHGCMADANGRIAALRRKLNGLRIPSVLPVAAAAPVAPPPVAVPEPLESVIPVPRRNLLEILLDPHSIQWLLASGGAVLVIGLLIWLGASQWLYDRWFLAVLLGVGNALLLAGGWAVLRFTRYQLAGRALTLLACLVMPLNLWYYDYRDILKIEHGGHLWVAALVVCILYAVSAAVMRDPMLVYVFVGGLALTGLLLLADHLVLQFWQASAPAVLLVVLGLVCIHLLRVFPPGEGPFTRDKFGLAFFWSGQAALAAGLLVVLIAQLAGGLFYEAVFKPLYDRLDDYLGYPRLTGQTELVSTLDGRLLALALVAAATYAYVYSDLVVRKIGVYLHLAIATFLWAEVLALSVVFWVWPTLPAVEVVIVALAVTGLLANIGLTLAPPSTSYLRRTGPALALGLSLLPLALGFVLHFRAAALPVYSPWYSLWHYTLGWWYVAAMAATAAASRIAAHLYRNRSAWATTVYLFGGGGSLMLAASGIVLIYAPGLPWVWIAPLLMVIPIAFLVAARLYRGGSMETPVVWAAHAMTLVLAASCLGAALQGFTVLHDDPVNLVLACFFGETALFYLLAAAWRDRVFAVYACAATAAAAVWQLLLFFNVPAESYIGAFAVLGLALLAGYRFAAPGQGKKAGLGRAAFQSGNAFLSLSAAAGALLTASSLAGRPFHLEYLVGMEAAVVVAGLIATALVRQAGWRRWYVLAAVGNTALTILVLILQIEWSAWQKLEVVCLALGVAVLIASHLGWFREQGRESDLVSFGLLVGSLLVAVPLTWAVLSCRFSGEDFDTFHTLNEVGMLAAGLLLLALGFATRIKSTTLAGAGMLAVYVLSLAAFLQKVPLLQTTAVYLMIGGGLVFGAGLLLSIYRDRLLALPQQVQRREGVFRVLNWR